MARDSIEESVIITDNNDIKQNQRGQWFFQAVEKARQEIMAQEDEEIFRILDSMSKDG